MKIKKTMIINNLNAGISDILIRTREFRVFLIFVLTSSLWFYLTDLTKTNWYGAVKDFKPNITKKLVSNRFKGKIYSYFKVIKNYFFAKKLTF